MSAIKVKNYTYNKELTDICRESNIILGSTPNKTVGISKVNNKLYSLLLKSFKGFKYGE